MLNTSGKLEELEGSIAHMQGVLETAQRVLGAAETAQVKLEGVRCTARRLLIGVAATSIVLALFVAAQRRHA
jgi:hypothetical protein